MGFYEPTAQENAGKLQGVLVVGSLSASCALSSFLTVYSYAAALLDRWNLLFLTPLCHCLILMGAFKPETKLNLSRLITESASESTAL